MVNILTWVLFETYFYLQYEVDFLPCVGSLVAAWLNFHHLCNPASSQ